MSKIKTSKVEPNRCSICIDTEDFEKFITLDCGHCFHELCIDKWSKQNSCPVCRKPIDSKKPILSLKLDTETEDRLMAMEEHKAQLESLSNEIVMRHLRQNPILFAIASNGGIFNVAPQEEKREEHFIVKCANCDNDMCLEHNTIYNCERCGEMFYCSLECEMFNRDAHDCANYENTDESDSEHILLYDSSDSEESDD